MPWALAALRQESLRGYESPIKVPLMAGRASKCYQASIPRAARKRDDASPRAQGVEVP